MQFSFSGFAESQISNFPFFPLFIVLSRRVVSSRVVQYLIGPYNSSPNLTPVPINAGLNNARFNSVWNIKRFIFPLLMGIFVIKLVKMKGFMLRMQYNKFQKNISKTWYFLFKMAHITPALEAFINATCKNNGDLGPAL